MIITNIRKTYISSKTPTLRPLNTCFITLSIIVQRVKISFSWWRDRL